MIDPTLEKTSDRAVGMYGAGVPLEEIVDFTGMPAGSIQSTASRRGVYRPKGDFDAEAMPMRITREAAEEAATYWTGVDLPGSTRHADYWNRQLNATDDV